MEVFTRTMPNHTASTPENTVASITQYAKRMLSGTPESVSLGSVSLGESHNTSYNDRVEMPLPQLGDIKERKRTAMAEGRASTMLTKENEDRATISRKRLLGS